MKYLSLYDFLGKPAGTQLGAEVAKSARSQGIQTLTREVSNPGYEGTVLLYPEDFLKFYFREPDSIKMDDLPEGHDWTGNIEDNDLPF